MPRRAPRARAASLRASFALATLTAIATRTAFALAAVATLAGPVSAARIMNYNLLNWSGSSGPARVPHMRAIARGIAPDVIVCQEMIDQAGVNLYRDQVLNVLWPGEFQAAPFLNGTDTDNALFYRTSVFTFLDTNAVATPLRDAMQYHLRLTGYTSAAAELRVYSFHLKSSMGFEANRFAEMQVIRAHADALPAGSHILFCGDYNVYTGSEPAFQHALSSTGTNVGRMKDPINLVGPWHDNLSFAGVHTQSPRTAQFGGGANGGMDDRFDFILESYNWDDGQGLELLESTYLAYGNDGRHLNVAIDGPLQNPTGPADNLAVGLAMADSIEQASDHLPVVADISVPARIGVSGPIAFGTVVQGAATSEDVLVSNLAATPGDALDYAFTAPSGFSAPGGPFALAPGASAPASIGLDTSTPGVKAGDLTIVSDAPDEPVRLVALSATVVAHAAASAESLVVALDDTLDFGSQSAGAFSDRTARVFNAGYGVLQAKLSLEAANIVGGDGRFTLVEPFVPVLVELEPAAYDVHFDDTGALADSTYAATLTFDAADDPSLPGAVALPPLVYHLSARVTSSTVDVDPGVAVTATALHAPRPNPAHLGRTAIRYDLVASGRVQLVVFDVRGRLVKTLIEGEQTAGANAYSWNGRDSAGRPVPGGVYFVRMVAPGATASTVRFVVLP